eukprot:136005_1
MDIIRLKAFRFCTLDIEKTADFYTNCMLMFPEDQSDLGSKLSVCFKFQETDVLLRFEMDRYINSKLKLLQLEKSITPDPNATLLVYVDNIKPFVDRVKEKKYSVLVEPQPINDSVCMAVVEDPNGLKIRLASSPLFNVDPDVHARLGYVTYEVDEYADLAKVKKFYKELYEKTCVVKLRRGAQESEQSGFRVVDSENSIEDLRSFVWFGNAQRAHTASLCLSHAVRRRSSKSVTLKSGHRSQSELLSGELKLPSEIVALIGSKTLPLFIGIELSAYDLEKMRKVLPEIDPEYSPSQIKDVPGRPTYMSVRGPIGLDLEIVEARRRDSKWKN